MIERLIFAALLLGLVACQGEGTTGGVPFSSSAVTPMVNGHASLSSAITPEQTAEDVLSDVPRCPGMEKLNSLEFDWPDIQNVQEKLADYHWGYYRCALTQPELSALYREGMLKPPFLWREVNHAEHNNGIVVLFYHPIRVTWNFLWILPGPDARSSYLVISRSDPGVPQAWECRLSLPKILFGASKEG